MIHKCHPIPRLDRKRCPADLPWCSTHRDKGTGRAGIGAKGGCMPPVPCQGDAATGNIDPVSIRIAGYTGTGRVFLKGREDR